MRVSKSTQISVPCTFALIWFGPSPMSTGTTTSADFLTFVVTAMWLSGSPQVRILAFTSSIRPFYIAQIRLVMGLHVILHTYPLRMPKRVPVRRTEDLLFPSFSLSLTRHTLGFANSCHQLLSSGLSPYRNCEEITCTKCQKSVGPPGTFLLHYLSAADA